MLVLQGLIEVDDEFLGATARGGARFQHEGEDSFGVTLAPVAEFGEGLLSIGAHIHSRAGCCDHRISVRGLHGVTSLCNGGRALSCSA